MQHRSPSSFNLPSLRMLLMAAWLALGVSIAQAQFQGASGLTMPTAESAEAFGDGPVRLRQPAPTPGATAAPRGEPTQITLPPARPEPYVAGEFEQFVQSQVGATTVRRLGVEPVVDKDSRPRGQVGATTVRRLGVELVSGMDSRPGDLSPLVPSDYVVGPGDEVLLTLWGSVDADLRLVVDRTGRISIPRVGTVQVSGVRHADLADVVNRRVSQVFRNFQSSVALGQLRGIRVFVTGFVVSPGAHTVSSLSTVVTALTSAGGPAAAGSFRNIELRRGKELVSRFDLYDLILKGDRTADALLQAGDVVHVGPVGAQVGFIGSVNKPAVLELKPGETVADALRMVGGFTAVADRSRLAIERLEDRLDGRVSELALPAESGSVLTSGTLLRAFSQVATALPSQRQNKRVKVEGEVLRPGEYLLPDNSTARDAIRAAGGLTPGAFVYASELVRESVRQKQQQNYDRALSDLETDLARVAGSQRVSTTEDATAQAARSAGTSRLIERLRAVRPDGRLVLQLAPDASELPDNLLLEDGDQIYVPPRPNAVGVFGSVFNAAAYLYTPGRTIDDYLGFAGGPTRGADESSIFVVRASGNVISARQGSGWFGSRNTIRPLAAQPGDTIFVPEEMDKTTLTQSFKEWTQILFQFGLGVAGIKSALE